MTRIKATIQQSATTKAAITTEGSKLVPKNILIGNFNADDVGLGNVTNESKTTMFTSPTFSGTVTITKSGTAVADAPQLILKDTDGTNETTHIYNHSGRTAIVSRNESANGIIDFIQDDGSTQTTAMKISSLGNVGIGVTAPTANLHISGTGSIGQNPSNFSNATIRVENNSPSANLYIDGNEIVGDNNLYLQTTKDDGFVSLAADNSSGTRVNIANASATGFAIGKGTSAATRPLDVSGEVIFRGTSTTPQPLIIFDKPDADNSVQQSRITIGTDNTKAPFEVQTYTNNNVFVSSDYRIEKNSSGATEHQIRIGNSNRLTVTNTQTSVTGSISASGGLSVLGNSTLGNQLTDTTVVSGDFTCGTGATKMHFDASEQSLIIGGSQAEEFFDGGSKLDLFSTSDVGVSEVIIRGHSQGAGRLYLGQSLAYGGGIQYEGDPSVTDLGSGATQDHISFYRRSNGTEELVFNYSQATGGSVQFKMPIVMDGAVRNITGVNQLSATTLTGTLQTAAQPNITSLGTLTGLNITGDLTVSGTTTTVNQTNLNLSDSIVGLNRGLTDTNINDSGLIIERGSTGDNAAILWDESEDRFIFGTTQNSPGESGNLTITPAEIHVTKIQIDSPAGSGVSLESSNSQSLKIQNQYGYLRVGPQNTTYAHFYTDRNRFFFNKKIVVDEGIVSAFNEDLLLTTAANPDKNTHTGVFIKDSNKFVGIGDNSPDRLVHIKSTTSDYVGRHPLMVEGTTSSIIEIKAGDNTSFSGIDFADQTIESGDSASHPGSILYDHSKDNMSFDTNNATRMTISSEGKVGIAQDSPEGRVNLQIKNLKIDGERAIIYPKYVTIAEADSPVHRSSCNLLLQGPILNNDSPSSKDSPNGVLNAGANIEIYGNLPSDAEHKNVSKQIFYDAVKHTFRDRDANPALLIIDSGSTDSPYSDVDSPGAGLITSTVNIQANKNVTITGDLTVSGNLNGTLSTAAQTNITSVGTLKTLTVSTDGSSNGTVTADALSVSSFAVASGGGGVSYNTNAFTCDTAGQFTANHSVTAPSLSGTLSTASQPNVTGVGTISTGVWQGTAIANAYVADLPTSKVTSGTFADARISSSSVTQHQASLSIATSQLTGNMPDARIIASNVTQHSGSITSVGTLTSLTVTGTITSNSTARRPVQNDETDTNPIRTIRRMSQSTYDGLSSPDINTLFIIE